MLGKPQDGSLAHNSFLGTCFAHLSPDAHPKGRGDAVRQGTHPTRQCGSCRETLLSPGSSEQVLGHACGTVLFTLQSTGRLLGAGSAPGGFTADSRAGPAQGQSLLRTHAVLVLVLTTPSNTGRLQAELKTQPSRIWPPCNWVQDPTHRLLEREAVSPAPGKCQHSHKHRASKPWGPGKAK